MDTWKTAASYDEYMGRWSRPMAREFLAWLAVPGGARWLDVGCGTGALAGEIAAGQSPLEIAGVDQSPGFVQAARSRLGPEARIRVGDAIAVPFDDDSFDATVSGLVLNFVSDPLRAVREMARVTVAGGAVATYLWDYAEGMEMIRRFWDAAIAIDPTAAELDEARRFPLCRAEAMAELWVEAGLTEVETAALRVATDFTTFDDYWEPFLGGQGPAPTFVAGLSAGDRDRLERHLRASLPTRPNGQVSLEARAWAIRGKV